MPQQRGTTYGELFWLASWPVGECEIGFGDGVVVIDDDRSRDSCERRWTRIWEAAPSSEPLF